MRVVVTSASGFLGGAAVRALRACGMDVSEVPRERLDDPPVGDVLIHLAEPGDRRVAEVGGERYRAQILERLERLLAKGYPKLVYISSAVVYGDRSMHAHSESDAVEPTDAYAVLKSQCEERALAHGAVVLRVANVYGLGMAQGSVMAAVLGQIPGQGPLRVLDDAPRRDFVWVEDLGHAVTCATQCAVGPSIYNIGTGVGTSVGDLARLALRLAGQPERKVVATGASATASCLVVDPSAARAKLGWGATINLEQGLQLLLRKP